MIKLMIVDDEILTRIGISSMFKWNELGYTIVGETDNGKTALEIAQKEQPDIILTDIKMPVMDGIEFIKEAKKRGIEAEFVVLSAYKEFDYVRDAMKLGAEDYLIKLELESDNLIKILDRISEKIKAKKNSLYRQNSSENFYGFHSKHIESKCIYDILTGKYDTVKDIESALRKANLTIRPENLVCIATQYCETENGVDLNAKGQKDISMLYGSALFKTINEIVDTYGDCYGCVVERHLFCFIVSLNENLPPPLQIPYFTKITDTIKEHINNTFNLSLAVRISCISNELAEIPILFKQICYYSGNAYYIKTTEMSNNLPNSQFDSSYPFEQEIHRIDQILSGDNNIDQIENLFECIVRKIKVHGFVSTKVLHGVCQTLIHIIDGFISKNCYLEHNWNRSNELLYLIKNCKTQEQYIEYIRSLKKKLAENIKLNAENNAIILKAKQYIERNYYKNISLESTAEHTNLSTAYFSRLFRQKTGENFMDYLTNIRIQNAKKYLKRTNKKVNEISEMVGYKNAYYFSRIFKKVTGKTPLEYRKWN